MELPRKERDSLPQVYMKPQTTLFSLEDVNDALDAVYEEKIDGAAVVMMQE